MFGLISQVITIRLDANGTFKPKEALSILDRLSAYDIHSIEQPIKAGNWLAMSKLCRETPIPIALDEELIGIHDAESRSSLLDTIKPSYIILKPTLLGGLSASKEWIDLASNKGIGWWITSALESNIGLNAIAQFTADYEIQIPQGLGTGQLFHNNIPSPLVIKDGALHYETTNDWDLSAVD
jgi:O-succinylbenzoate synthase